MRSRLPRSQNLHTGGNGPYKCAGCLKKFTVRNGTIFEDSKLPLRTWFKAIFLIVSNSKSVSSMKLHRLLGITQKSAWFVVHRIREIDYCFRCAANTRWHG